jgi:type I restriction enzyme, S subunit
MNWADREYAIGRGVAAIRHKERPELQPFVRAVIEYGLPGLLAQATGSTFPNVSASQLAGLWWPPLKVDEQRAIAHILGTLDDKIELNRRMNKTLEATARTLFKSWFVDFDPVGARAEGRDPGLPKPLADLFPARLVDSELGEIPEGWAVSRLGDLSGVEKGLSYKGEGLADAGGLPMINLGCFAGAGVFRAENIKWYRGDYKARHVVRAGDLVIANTDMTQNRIILGSPALIPELAGEQRFLFTHHTFAFRFKAGAERWRRYVYFTLLQPEFREVAEGFATGTTVLALPRDGLLDLAVVLPPESLLLAFERQVDPLLAAADQCHHESRTLAAIRDTLLPRLISGELRVTASPR